MVEYTAAMVGVLGVMALLLFLGFKMSEKYDPLKIFFIAMFFIWGNVVLNVAAQIIAANSGPADLVNSVAIAQSAWIVVTIVSLIYITIYVIPDSWRAIQAQRKAEKTAGKYEE